MFKILGSVVNIYRRVSIASSYFFFSMWDFQEMFPTKQEVPH